mgnify:CR=1 FL=1
MCIRDSHCPANKDHSEWDWSALSLILRESFGLSPEAAGLSDQDNNAALKEKLKAALRSTYAAVSYTHLTLPTSDPV